MPALSGTGLAFTPGARPMSALAAQLAMVTDVPADAIEAELRDQPARAAARMRDLCSGSLLLVVDQFEELFTSNVGITEQRGSSKP